jgi:aryl-alcohol dehydrogenase-like predicted oxidoreductase
MMSRTLGAHGPSVSALGLGSMGMSDLYGPADRSEATLPTEEVAGTRYDAHQMRILDSQR